MTQKNRKKNYTELMLPSVGFMGLGVMIGKFLNIELGDKEGIKGMLKVPYNYIIVTLR